MTKSPVQDLDSSDSNTGSTLSMIDPLNTFNELEENELKYLNNIVNTNDILFARVTKYRTLYVEIIKNIERSSRPS